MEFLVDVRQRLRGATQCRMRIVNDLQRHDGLPSRVQRGVYSIISARETTARPSVVGRANGGSIFRNRKVVASLQRRRAWNACFLGVFGGARGGNSPRAMQ